MSNPPNAITFPVIAGTSSPAFQFAPIASNSSSGWATACTNSACASTATWSTRATDATLDFTFTGVDCALEGNVQGNTNVEMTLDGKKVDWNPSNGLLFGLSSLDQKVEHKVQLKVLSASADAQLTVGQARINASTETQSGTFRGNFYTLPSNGPEFSYTGFVQQTASASGSMSPINYVSTNAGDTVKATLNATTLAIFGPCGPSSGMMTVALDDRTTTVNTTKPVQADDCMLYISRGLSDAALHYLTITNADGRPLGLNRVETVMVWMPNNKSASKAGMVVGIVLGVIVAVAIGIVAYSMRSKKQRDKMNRSCSVFCS